MLIRLLAVCAGGAVGSGLRYMLYLGATRWLGLALPWGTLAVNLLGSFALGYLMHWLPLDEEAAPLRLLLTTGLLGGFTTYSTFNYETLEYTHRGEWGLAAANVGLTLVLCLAGGALGIALARSVGA